MTDTPNPLKGNPFAEAWPDGVIDAVVFSADDSPMQPTEILLDQINRSVLALAFEVRTQTLAAAHQNAQHLWIERRLDALDVGSEEEFLKRMDELTNEINTRLGLGGR